LSRPANYGKAAGQAKRLHEAGVTAEDVPSLYGYVVSWAKSADLGTMLGQVDRWRQEQRRPTAPPKSTANPVDEWAARMKQQRNGVVLPDNGLVIETKGTVR